MAVEATELSQYEGKKVVLVQNQGEGKDAIELEGTAEKANALGVLLKPKGKVKLELIELDTIEDIRLAPDTSANLKAKKLKVVKLGQARSHLLERHGYTLAQVNELTEDAAYELHAGLNHVELDLGHVHEDKAETPAAQAVAEAEAAESVEDDES